MFGRLGALGTGFGRLGIASGDPWWFPGATLDLDFARGRGMLNGLRKPLSDLLSTTRSSPKWALDATGLARQFADNVAAITDLGLSVEESRTTLVPKARRLDDGAVWTLSSVTASAVAGIDGASGSATRLTATGSNGTITSPTTSLSSAARRLAPFIRRVAGTGNIDLSLDNGSTYTTLVGVTSSWQRLGIGQTLANPQIKIRIATSGDVVDIDFAAGETGSFDTSPIESTSAAATRAADAITVNNFSSWFTAGAGTLFGEVNQPSAVAGRVANFNNGTADNRIELLLAVNGTTYQGLITDATVTQAGPTSGTVSVGVTSRGALAWASNDFAVSGNGAAVGTDVSGTVPSVTALRLGSSVGISYLNGYLRRVAYKPVRDASLQSMTA